MSDPRNTAHDKKVQHDKDHQKPAPTSGNTVVAEPEVTDENGPTTLEKSVAVLSKLKEMEFHSRANIETLAGLMLTVEDELKQKEFSDPIAETYSAQDDFHSKLTGLITSYGEKCESLKPAA